MKRKDSGKGGWVERSGLTFRPARQQRTNWTLRVVQLTDQSFGPAP